MPLEVWNKAKENLLNDGCLVDTFQGGKLYDWDCDCIHTINIDPITFPPFNQSENKKDIKKDII